jgi:ubiquinone/menaquinone biosynthesis C-methylase UbiE
MAKGHKNKWEKYSNTFVPENHNQATYRLTAENALKILKKNKIDLQDRKIKMLDIGCGYGEITALLSKNTAFEITAIDISPTALKAAAAKDTTKRVKFQLDDIYNLSFPTDTFDIIVSFGYTSAASYQNVQPELRRVLKPNGLCLIDFRALSLYFFMFPKKLIKHIKESSYAAGLFGVKKYFKKHDLKLIKTVKMATFPPLGNIFKENFYYYFEKIIGRWLSFLLGRVGICAFRNNK